MTAPPHALLCPSNFIFKFADAPWSHECRKLLPIWDKLGEQYESHKDIMIAKIDVTANDILSVGMDRYPFFTLFPAGADFQVRSSWAGLWRHSCTPRLCLHATCTCMCIYVTGRKELFQEESFGPFLLSTGFWVDVAT